MNTWILQVPADKKKARNPYSYMVSRLFRAETEGFEPSWQFPAKRISSAPRYDRFDTSPHIIAMTV